MNFLPVVSKNNWRSLVRCSSEQARALIKLEIALKYGVLPIYVFNSFNLKELSLISSKKLSLEEVQELKFISGSEIKIESYFYQGLDLAILAAYKEDSLKSDDTLELLNSVIHRAETLDASDIHLEPYRNAYRLRYRVCGSLISDKPSILDTELAKSLIRCIKVKSKITNIIGACDGHFTIDGIASLREVRVSIMPVVTGDKIVLRFFGNEFLSKNKNDALSLLGLNNLQIEALKLSLSLSSGTILVAGPTGSGKSTLLYSCIKTLDYENLNIVTVEDPVEHRIEGASQVDLSKNKTMSYSNVLPFILRQDPDVLMLGEIRDAKTANLAFEAALTGKTILTTIHASNSKEALVRLDNLGLSNYLIKNSLRLIISGRLIPKNCQSCAVKKSLPKKFINHFKLNFDYYHASKGCENCKSERIGAYEVLPINQEVKSKIGSLDFEYITIANQIITYLYKGIISYDSACNALGISRGFFDQTH